MSPEPRDGFDPEELPPWEMDDYRWEVPIPMAAAEPDPFPTEALDAPWLARWIEDEAEATQTPPDLAGVASLAALSTACHGKVVVEVRPGYREPVNLYVACALDSGNRKSAVFADATEPIYSVETELTEERREQVAIGETQRRILEKRQAEAESAAAKNRDPIEAGAAQEEAQKLASELSGFPIAVPLRFVVDDITSEALCGMLPEQGGVLSVLSAEGGIFETMAGRYSNGVPNLDVWLKGHSGDKLRVDRKGRPSEIVDRPCITLGLVVQPDVLRTLIDKPGFRGRGLLARFLYSVPVSKVGNRKIAPQPVSDAVRSNYCEAIALILRGTERLVDPIVVTLSLEASTQLTEFERETEPKLRSVTGELAHMKDWGSKLLGAVVRLAGLLHVAENPTNWADLAISGSTTRGAIFLGHYFTSHLYCVADLMRADKVVEDAVRILRWIDDRSMCDFTKRDLHRSLLRVFPKVDDLEKPLLRLEDHFYIRSMDSQYAGKGRPPSQRFETNPKFFQLRTELTDPSSEPISVSSVGGFSCPPPPDEGYFLDEEACDSEWDAGSI